MRFYYAIEKAKFDRMWDGLRKEYEAAGMEETAIQKLYDFDWQWFRSQRTYINHNQQLPEAVIREDSDEGNSRLLQKLASLSVLPDDEAWHGRYGWLETISDERIVSSLEKSSSKDVELLTLFMSDDLGQ